MFLLIGRILRDKGVTEFVEAAALVKELYPNARFQLLGAIYEQNRIAIDREIVARWEKLPGIEYLGTCEDLRA